VSAVIDPVGGSSGHWDWAAEGVLDAALPQPLAATLYARLGDGPAGLMVPGGAGSGARTPLRAGVDQQN